MEQFEHDVLIIGSGGAGLTAALALSRHLRVAVLTKGTVADTATAWAQGGIAAVVDPQDSFTSHIQDTLIAGDGLCHPEAVAQVVEAAPSIIDQLCDLGVDFDRHGPSPRSGNHPWHLTREGGHSARRVLHVADATGAAISDSLINASHSAGNLIVFEHRAAVDLITSDRLGEESKRCVGAYALNTTTEQVEVFAARHVIIATGGASKVYLYTSNPDGSTGDGIAMAWRAGARVANMEFNQFHPTCLYHPHAKSFLITEAVRGEGGRLLRPDGTPFMASFDAREELAPRDVVARAIDHEMKRLGLDCMFLDISHRPAAFIKEHFPTIHSRCLEFGIDITREPIPVVPAAHYTCGGVMVNADGETDLANLYAIGEASFTGLHGANRMASNSLLECMVYAHRSAAKILQRHDETAAPPRPDAWDDSQVIDSDEAVVISHNWEELRRFMWDYVGIVRTDKRLQRAKRRVQLLEQEIADYYAAFTVTADMLELRNLVQVAGLIIESALQRQESRGLHYTLDHPNKSAVAKDTILVPERMPHPPPLTYLSSRR